MSQLVYGQTQVIAVTSISENGNNTTTPFILPLPSSNPSSDNSSNHTVAAGTSSSTSSSNNGDSNTDHHGHTTSTLRSNSGSSSNDQQTHDKNTNSRSGRLQEIIRDMKQHFDGGQIPFP